MSDIHANYYALKVIANYISKIKFNKILCAGDIVGYYTRPNETIEWIKANNVISVLGNHDKAIFDDSISTNFNIYAKQAIAWTKRNIKHKNKEFLKKLQKTYTGKISGKLVYMTHGSPSNPFHDYVYYEDVDNFFLNELFDKIPDIIIMGQTHKPFIKKIHNTIIVNSGSVGQPRDKNYKTSFAIYDERNNDVDIIRLDYEIDTLIKETRSELSEKLAKRLIMGK